MRNGGRSSPGPVSAGVTRCPFPASRFARRVVFVKHTGKPRTLPGNPRTPPSGTRKAPPGRRPLPGYPDGPECFPMPYRITRHTVYTFAGNKAGSADPGGRRTSPETGTGVRTREGVPLFERKKSSRPPAMPHLHRRRGRLIVCGRHPRRRNAGRGEQPLRAGLAFPEEPRTVRCAAGEDSGGRTTPPGERARLFSICGGRCVPRFRENGDGPTPPRAPPDAAGIRLSPARR